METETLYRLLEDQCVEWKPETDTSEHLLKATAVFRFSGEYPAFSGHFPDNPVLPAIVQLAMVRYAATRAIGKNLILLNYSKTKFRGIIRPEDLVEARVMIEKEKVHWAGSFSPQ